MSDNPPNTSNLPPLSPSKKSSSRPSSLWIWIILVLIILGGGGYFLWIQYGGGKKEEVTAKPKSSAIRVTTAQIHTGDLGVYLTALGSVIPLNSVTVKTRVDGQLMSIKFEEGQLVHEGDSLAQIDPRPYQVQLEQAEAQMARDEATLKNDQLDLDRYKTLWSQDSIAKQTLDTQEGTVKSAAATVDTDRAQIDSVKLNLLYCNITAPVTGRVGLRLVDNGNIVHASDTSGLVVITQFQPINVEFTLPEDNLPPVLQKLNAGDKLEVEVLDREKKHKLAQGFLASADNLIDSTTGTLKFKALFGNEDYSLFPNQFVNTRLLVETKHNVVLAPLPAIQRGTQNNFVYGLNEDNTVKVRPVTLGAANAQEVEIVSGLAANDVVVVDGVDKLQDGSHVMVQKQKDPK